jgi:leishmanolysin-like peptidase
MISNELDNNFYEMSHLREQHLHPYCNRVKRDPLETECSEDRNSVALCNLVQHTYPLPDLYQNFEFIPHISQTEIPYYGGSVALADFCPYIQEFTWRSDNIAIRGSNCLYEENNPRN